VKSAAGEAWFNLGNQAEKWATAIANPRGRLDKLGVKTGAYVALCGAADPDFAVELAGRATVVDEEEGLDTLLDLVFYGIEELADLGRLPEIRQRIKPDGAIWVVSPRGKGAPVKETEIMAVARASGLVDTKVVAFSATHSALKLVIPKAQR
jgi:hypothetical protein